MTRQQAEEMQASGTVRYAHIYEHSAVLVGWNNIAQVVSLRRDR